MTGTVLFYNIFTTFKICYIYNINDDINKALQRTISILSITIFFIIPIIFPVTFPDAPLFLSGSLVLVYSISAPANALLSPLHLIHLYLSLDTLVMCWAMCCTSYPSLSLAPSHTCSAGVVTPRAAGRCLRTWDRKEERSEDERLHGSSLSCVFLSGRCQVY